MYLAAKKKPNETQGPVSNANKIVPIPTTPAKYQPNITALISMNVLIETKENFVFFGISIINPSLDPGLTIKTDSFMYIL
jgi:hypothetical protein